METGARVRSWAAVALAAASLVVAGLVVDACSEPAQPVAAVRAPETPTDYFAPPELTDAARLPGGGVALSGTAKPGAVIRLASPSGAALLGTASTAGTWTITAPAGATPRLYSLSEILSGRPVRAKGYLATLPSPSLAAVVLRPGGGAEPMPGAEPRLRLSGVDFDGSGAGVAAGLAPPGDTVRLQLDGVETGVGRANARGVFTVPLAQTLRPGSHDLTATTARAEARAVFGAAPAGAIARPPVAVSRVAGAWRIDWMTPGGGVQTTLVFDPTEGIA